MAKDNSGHRINRAIFAALFVFVALTIWGAIVSGQHDLRLQQERGGEQHAM